MVGRVGVEPTTKRLRVRRWFTAPFKISHLRRLPLRIPASPWHTYGTSNLSWSQSGRLRPRRATP